MVMPHVTENWMSAKEIALRLGYQNNYQAVVSALSRLVKAGKLERLVVKTGPTRSRDYEERFVYRTRGVARGMLPHWLAPQVPQFRIITRTIFRRK